MNKPFLLKSANENKSARDQKKCASSTMKSLEYARRFQVSVHKFSLRRDSALSGQSYRAILYWKRNYLCKIDIATFNVLCICLFIRELTYIDDESVNIFNI